MLRILVADNNLELCNTLEEFFNQEPDMEVVGCAYDGEQTLERIQKLNPDVVILDITMPHLDGMGVLERLGELNLPARPKIIMLTAFGREDIIRKFVELGANYFIVKPFDLTVLSQRVRQFADSEEEPEIPSRQPVAPSKGRPLADLELEVTELLHQMGVPAHFKGYNYLRDAVVWVLKDERLRGASLTRDLYPRLAAKYRSTIGGVEAAIRNAIIAAWDHGNKEFLARLTGKTGVRERFPTNSQIIARLAEMIRFPTQSSVSCEDLVGSPLAS